MTHIQHIYSQRYRHFLPMALSCLCICVCFCACEKDDEELEQPTLRTILFYIAGDNNLTGEVGRKVENAMDAILPDNCRLLIYTDTRTGNPQLQEVVPGKDGNTLEPVCEYPTHNSADARIFGEVLQTVAAECPSASYGLIFFSHASGWLPEGTYADAHLRSAGTDHLAEMEITDLAAAIPAGMFRFIIFEACFMASVEAVWELKDKTDYIIASSAEIVSPGFTPVYAQALPLLFRPEADLKGCVQQIAADYAIRQADYQSLTLSLIRTAGLPRLAEAVKGCDTSILTDTEGIQPFDRYGKALFFDFGDTFSRLLTDSGREAMLQALDETVTYQVSSARFMPSYGGFDIRAHSGLTTYIPQENYPNLNDAYKQLNWYKALCRQ